jgi:hypothetical protein
MIPPMINGDKIWAPQMSHILCETPREDSQGVVCRWEFRVTDSHFQYYVYCSTPLHCVDLAFGIIFPSTCTFGCCSLFFYLTANIYTACFCLTGHLHVYNVTLQPESIGNYVITCSVYICKTAKKSKQ